MQPRIFRYTEPSIWVRAKRRRSAGSRRPSHRPSPTARPNPGRRRAGHRRDRGNLQHRRGGALPHHPRDHGPVGGVVRPVQAALPGAGEARRRGGRPVDPGQGRRGRQPAAERGAAGAQFTHGGGGHRRQAGGRLPRRHARGPGAGHGSTRSWGWRRGWACGCTAGAADDAQDGAEADADTRLPRDAGPEIPAAYADARAAMERGDLDGAARAFEQELAANPADPVAKTGLAQVNLIRRVSSYDQAKARRDAAEHPADVEAQARVRHRHRHGPDRGGVQPAARRGAADLG